jgi:hypothetical protein
MKTDHQGPGYFEAVPIPPDGHVPGEFIAYRQLDPVRAAALHEAVACAGNYWQPGVMDPFAYRDEILRTAERFEAWLAGPEVE